MAALQILRKRRALPGAARQDPESAWRRPIPGICWSRRELDSIYDCAFTMVEMLLVVTVIGVVAAMAIPQAYRAVKAYRLHADASAIAGQLNVARMRAASQFAPYRVVISITSGTYWREKLCGDRLATADAACTSPYDPLSTADIESGTQYALAGDTFSSCHPPFLSGSGYSGTIQADPSPCPNPLEIYFNTRGVPVDSNGNPIGNGGAVIYVHNQDNQVDAVTVAIGGSVTIWNWNAAGNAWAKR